MSKKDLQFIISKIRHIPDFPKKGILFHDITTLLQDSGSFNITCKLLKKQLKDLKFTKIVAIESRGFIFGAVLAYLLKKSFVLVRKAGKLPAKTIQQEYALEYGTAKIEIHRDAITKGDKVIIFDDLLATGGTMLAACKLIEKLGGKVVGCSFIINMPDLKGAQKLKKYPIYSLIEFSGD